MKPNFLSTVFLAPANTCSQVFETIMFPRLIKNIQMQGTQNPEE